LIDRRHYCAEAASLHFLASAAPRFSKPADLEFDAEARIIEYHNPSQLFRLAEKSEQIMSYLAIAAMLVLVLFPVLVPAIITAAHAILGTNRPAPTVGYLRPAAA
jgi:hypothetical protein